MQTKIIKYSLKDRGRQYRGQDRNFDIRAVVNAINSPECQERVRKRDMLGYYGHWPRVKFGLNPAEGGLDKAGRATVLTPAMVTVKLKAYPDGTIEHQEEFLDTDPGKVAAQLYNNRVGGFSSAIDLRGPQFFGFDYVLEPNYSTNRGWALDAVSGMSDEEVSAAIQGEQLRGAMALLDRVTAERDGLAAALENMQAEREQFLSLLSKKGISESQALDAVDAPGRSPALFSTDLADRMRADAALFHAAQLPGFDVPEDRPAEFRPERAMPGYGRLLRGLFGG